MAENKRDFHKEIRGYIDRLKDVMEDTEGDRFQIPEGSGHYPTPEHYWQTAVSQSAPYKIFIRGYPLVDLMGNYTYTEILWLTFTGELPTEREREMLDTILGCIVDHQYVAANVGAARFTASGNPQFIPALAAGILTIGANTVSPFLGAELINRAYDLMKKENLSYEDTAKRIIAEFRAEKKRIPGFGHPIHKKYDPRAVRLLDVAERLGFLGEKTRLFLAIHDEFERAYGKGQEIPINIDGAMACVFNDMGWNPLLSTAIATLSFMPGLMAQVVEELTQPFVIRWIHDSEYVGVPPRPLPVRKKGA